MYLIRLLILSFWWLSTPVFTTFNKVYFHEPSLIIQFKPIKYKRYKKKNVFYKNKLKLIKSNNFETSIINLKQPNKYASKTHHLSSLPI